MGLAERRVTQDFQTNEMPKLQSEIDQAAGFTVPVEVHWDNLVVDGQSHLFVDSWKAVYFQPLILALQSITKDEMGREALKQGLERVVVQNTTGYYYPDNWAKFEDKTLTLDHDPTTSVNDTQPRANRLIQVLENGL